MGADAGDRGLRRLVISGLGSKGQAAVAVYSSMSRTAYNLALHEHGPKLYDKLTEDMEDHLQEMCVSIEAAQGFVHKNNLGVLLEADTVFIHPTVDPSMCICGGARQQAAASSPRTPTSMP
uniref:Uncharacterized protein n=1 Tax=Oryza meridionalis TaxID=40149 RepID=A0A0E0EHA6_9ORYZ